MPNSEINELRKYLLDQGEDPELLDLYFSEMENQPTLDVPAQRAISGPAPGSMRYAMAPGEEMQTYDPAQPMTQGTYSRSKFVDQPEEAPPATVALENKLMNLAGSFDPSDRWQRGMMDMMTEAAGTGDPAIMQGALNDYRQSQMEREGYTFGPYGGIFRGGKQVAKKPVLTPVDFAKTEKGMRLKGEQERETQASKTRRELQKALIERSGKEKKVGKREELALKAKYNTLERLNEELEIWYNATQDEFGNRVDPEGSILNPAKFAGIRKRINKLEADIAGEPKGTVGGRGLAEKKPQKPREEKAKKPTSLTRTPQRALGLLRKMPKSHPDYNKVVEMIRKKYPDQATEIDKITKLGIKTSPEEEGSKNITLREFFQDMKENQRRDFNIAIKKQFEKPSQVSIDWSTFKNIANKIGLADRWTASQLKGIWNKLDQLGDGIIDVIGGIPIPGTKGW